MTELSRGLTAVLGGKPVQYDLPEKRILTFGSWEQEAVYLAMPRDHLDGVHATDLVLRLGYGEQAAARGVGPEAIEAAIEELVAGQCIVRPGDGQFLYKINEECSVVLNYI